MKTDLPKLPIKFRTILSSCHSPPSQNVVQWTLAVVAVLFVVIGVAEGQTCNQEESCLGGRPRTPIGCCPVEGGDDCGTEAGVECDTDLGYRCLDDERNVTAVRGRCTGRYNFHVTETQTNQVSLEWTDFIPPNYYFEYVLLFRQDTYSENTSDWKIVDIGTRPEYTVRKLSSGTLYFMQLAVWADARATVLGNRSEVIWFMTQSVEYCTHGEERLEVGQVVENCEERCTCTATGEMDCSPLCPQSELPEGCSLIYEDECSCNTTIQCSNEEASCEFQGREYEAGSTVELSCGSCHCNRGTMSCTYPEECEVLEASEHCPHPTATTDPSGGCCPIWSCEDESSVTSHPTEECEYGGSSFADGATWMDTTICSRCTCETGHVRCEVMCEEPETPEGCVNPVRQREESGCCDVILCDSMGSIEGEEECSYNDTTYRIGDTFTIQCSLCMCVEGNSINCSFTSCPPVELPLPNVLCPYPHVRRDGCCDTVYCMEDNIDAETLMNRLMALSFAPTSLTVSFHVDHTTSSGTVTQDRYEVMTSDRGGDAGSWTSRTFTTTTVDADDNLSSPADLLHADAAIRVDDRVYITLGNLNPNTTYYVRVQPVIKSDVGVTESQKDNVTLLGFIVAKTAAEHEITCQVGDVKYKNGGIVSQSCEEVCTCLTGQVKCKSACPEQDVIMAPSAATCPRPMLVESEHSCCKTWKCFPEEGGCVHDNIILKNGEQVYEGSCDRKCKCTDGEISCVPVCPMLSPAPRARCVLTNVTGSCCPVWMCPKESKPATRISLSTQTGFRGRCVDQDSFKTSLRTAFENRLVDHLPCADRESPYFISCWISDVVITCPPLDAYRKRRQTSEIEIVAVVTANITEWNTVNKIKWSLNATGSAVMTLFTSTDSWLLLDNGENITATGDFLSFGINFACEDGFVFNRNACVPDYLYVPPIPVQRHNISMTLVKLTHDFAALAWPSLSPNSLTYVIGLVIDYRKAEARAWNRTMVMDPTATRHTVTSLCASCRYVARLVALTNLTTVPRVSLSTVQFTTKTHEVLNSTLTFDPLQVSLSLTSVTIRWTPLAADVTSVISKMQITYRESQKTDDISARPLGVHDSHVNLVGLSSGTAYISRFVVSLANGTTITTPPLHFVTMAEDSSDVFLVPLLATCAVIVVLSILLPVAFFVWRRTRRKSTAGTAFENKTYGLNISSLCTTRAKNDHARPQDQEDGSVASTTDAGDCGLQA